jgi:hypothetical protein
MPRSLQRAPERQMAWSIAMGIPGFLHQNGWDFYMGVGLRTTPMWMFITKNLVSMVFY